MVEGNHRTSTDSRESLFQRVVFCKGPVSVRDHSAEPAI